MPPPAHKPFHARHSLKTGVSGEHLIATEPRKSYLYARSPCLTRNEIGIDSVHGGLIHRPNCVWDRFQRVLLRNGNLPMLSSELLRDRPGVFRLAVVSLAEDKRECIEVRVIATEERDQAARVNPTRQKDAHGNIADQLRAKGLFQNPGKLVFEVFSILSTR